LKWSKKEKDPDLEERIRKKRNTDFFKTLEQYELDDAFKANRTIK